MRLGKIKKKHFKGKQVFWLISLYQKRKGHKMPTGPQGQKILYTTLFMGKVCRKNPGFDKDKTDVMFGLTVWLCIFPFPICTSQVIKVPFENKVMGLAHRSLVSLCRSFFPFPFFSLCSSFRMTPWNTGALLAFCVNQGRSNLCSLCFAILLPMPSSWGYPWILLGLGPSREYSVSTVEAAASARREVVLC